MTTYLLTYWMTPFEKLIFMLDKIGQKNWLSMYFDDYFRSNWDSKASSILLGIQSPSTIYFSLHSKSEDLWSVEEINWLVHHSDPCQTMQTNRTRYCKFIRSLENTRFFFIVYESEWIFILFHCQNMTISDNKITLKLQSCFQLIIHSDENSLFILFVFYQ